MFAGLVLTSISTVVMRAALFQRKSRSGWLEELDVIREEALDEPEGGVGQVADPDDIWTDLRDGGEYEDPHEIASLYASDDTPDRPVAKSAAKGAKAGAKGSPRSHRGKPRPQEPDGASTPPAPPAPPAPNLPLSDADDIWTPTSEPVAPAAQYDDQIWVQPAPHPIRPSEMWHPAELTPAPLGQDSFASSASVPQERVASSDVQDQAVRERYAPPAAAAQEAHPVPALEEVGDPVPTAIDERTTANLESELVAAADVAVVGELADRPDVHAEPAIGPVGQLTAAPVARRVRRDRPSSLLRTDLPATVAAGAATHDHIDHAVPGFGPDGELMHDAPPLEDRGDRSPLPTEPLPPAALPTRSNRLPSLDSLPATPSSVVAPRSVGPFDQPASDAALDERSMFGRAADGPVVDEPPFDPTALVVEEPALVTAQPEPELLSAAEPEPVATRSVDLVIGGDGLLAVPGMIVRIGGARLADASIDVDGALVRLSEGWCWASPGEGGAQPVRIELPTGRLTVAPNSTALAVVEADGSVFIIVADGGVELRGGTGAEVVEQGTIVMIDPAGASQTDAASDAEIESDPIVAENLALDAEL